MPLASPSHERILPHFSGTWATLRSLTPGQRHAVLASYLGWMLDAFDFFILVLVIKHVAKDFHTTKTAVSQAIFITLAMRPLGALAFGLLADRFGRRPTLMFNVAFFSIMELLSGFAPSLGWFLVLRALYGFGMGGEWCVGASLVMETIPPRARGVISGILQEGYPVGYLLAAVVYKCVFPFGGWRWMFVIGFLPALLAWYIRRVGGRIAGLGTGERRHSNELECARNQANPASDPCSLETVPLPHHADDRLQLCSHGTQDLYPSVLLESQLGFSEQNHRHHRHHLQSGRTSAAASSWVPGRNGPDAGQPSSAPLCCRCRSSPLWAYASSPIGIAAGAFLMQFAIQGAWGVVPAHLNELSPSAVRGTFPGLAYQLGNLFAASNIPLQNKIAAAHGADYRIALASVVACGVCAVALAAYLGPEAKDTNLADDSPPPASGALPEI